MHLFDFEQSPLQGMALRRVEPRTMLWTYCHPYDFDPAQPFARADGLGLAMSFLLWRNRRSMYQKVQKLLSYGTAPSFADRLRSGEFKDIASATKLAP